MQIDPNRPPCVSFPVRPVVVADQLNCSSLLNSNSGTCQFRVNIARNEFWPVFLLLALKKCTLNAGKCFDLYTLAHRAYRQNFYTELSVVVVLLLFSSFSLSLSQIPCLNFIWQFSISHAHAHTDTQTHCIATNRVIEYDKQLILVHFIYFFSINTKKSREFRNSIRFFSHFTWFYFICVRPKYNVLLMLFQTLLQMWTGHKRRIKTLWVFIVVSNDGQTVSSVC